MVYVIRELRALDIFVLDKMYDSLSGRSKLFLHVGYLGFESVGFSWLQMHIALFLSSMRGIRMILKRLFPFLAFFSLAIVSEEDTMIGFSFVKLKGRFERGGWWGELIMGLRDDYQGRGLGSKLMRASIKQARSEGIKGIFGTALKINVGTLHFDQKHGFKIKRVVKEGVRWHGRKYDNVEMWLDTTVPNPRYDGPKQDQAIFVKDKKQD